MEKKNGGLIIAVVFLAICVLGLGGYLVYDKVLNKEKPKPVEREKEEEKKEETTNTRNQNSMDQEQLGKELFERINTRTSYNSSNGDFVLITGNRTYNSLSSFDILDVVSNIVPDDLKKHNSEIDEYPSRLDNPDLPYEYSIKKSDFENYFHKLFGNNNSFDYNGVEVENNEIHFYWTNRDSNVECYQLVSYDHSNYLSDNELAVYVAVNRSDNDLCDWIELNTYKVTFKKESNNNWYWYSTTKAN